ncbi:hypothetical protein HQ489_02160 [Candidatus Woesearchaeota archaeon]|nr:hypothetical protein [Candidatus Woesearchaeota archaeon]
MAKKNTKYQEFLNQLSRSLKPGKLYNVSVSIDPHTPNACGYDGSTISLKIQEENSQGDLQFKRSGGRYDHDEIRDIPYDRESEVEEFRESIEIILNQKGYHVAFKGLSFSISNKFNIEEKPTLEEKLIHYNPNGRVTAELTKQAMNAFPEYKDPREALAVYMGFAA